MISGWVAGSIRARAMARRRLGRVAVRSLATSPSLADALDALADGPYGHDVRPEQTLREAQHSVRATLLWNLRVLAGWMPREGVAALRSLAAWFELLNVEAHLRSFAGQGPGEFGSALTHRLGTLATAWPRLSRTASNDELRDALTATPWGDPGDEGPRAIQLSMRAAYAERVAVTLPEAAAWARSAVGLLVAREVILAGRTLPIPAAASAAALLGPQALAVTSLEALRAALPTEARHVLAAVDRPTDLWRAELAWWQLVEDDAFRLLQRPRHGRATVCGAVALLGVDAWRVSAALELAAREGTQMEAFDAVA